MIDIVGTVIALLRADSAVAGIVGTRVRGGEPAQGDSPPFVIVARITRTRNTGGRDNRRAGLQEVYLQVKAVGTSHQQAGQLYGACSTALHMHGPLVDTSSRAIFTIADDVGSASGVDSGTAWPYEDGTMRVIAAAEALMA